MGEMSLELHERFCKTEESYVSTLWLLPTYQPYSSAIMRLYLRGFYPTFIPSDCLCIVANIPARPQKSYNSRVRLGTIQIASLIMDPPICFVARSQFSGSTI